MPFMNTEVDPAPDTVLEENTKKQTSKPNGIKDAQFKAKAETKRCKN